MFIDRETQEKVIFISCYKIVEANSKISVRNWKLLFIPALKFNVLNFSH